MGKDSTTESSSKPVYPKEASLIFGRERELLSDLLLPAEGQRIRSLSALGRGDYGGAGQILSPAFNAARQAQSKLSAGVSDLPANVAAPVQEAQAQQISRQPFQLQSGAPDQLSEITKALLGPQFGALLAPGSQGTSTSSPSDSSKAMSALAAAAAIAAAVAAI